MPVHSQDSPHIFQNNGSRQTIKNESQFMLSKDDSFCVIPAIVTSIKREDKILYKIKNLSLVFTYDSSSHPDSNMRIDIYKW